VAAVLVFLECKYQTRFKHRLTQLVGEPFDVSESGHVEFRAAVTRFPIVVDLHRAPGKSVFDYFPRVTADGGRVHVRLVPGPRRPNGVLDHVRVGDGRRRTEEISDGVLVRRPGVAVLARAEPHDVAQFSVRPGDLGRETHVTRPGTVNVHEQRDRIVDVDVKPVGVEEIRLDHLP